MFLISYYICFNGILFLQHTGLIHVRPKAPRDGSAHPVKDGSHTQYYHTVTAASSSRSPMTKVMDIFRNRSHASVPPEDRKRVSTQCLYFY